MKNNRILLIEDDVNFRWVAQSFFNILEYKTIIAKTGQEAFHLPSSNIALILMTIWLPDMDASKLCQHFREVSAGKHIPIIAVGAFPEDIKTDCLRFGFDDYLQKPTSLRLLTEMIEKWTRKNHNHSEYTFAIK